MPMAFHDVLYRSTPTVIGYYSDTTPIIVQVYRASASRMFLEPSRPYQQLRQSLQCTVNDIVKFLPLSSMSDDRSGLLKGEAVASGHFSLVTLLVLPFATP
jgi:hypothetical protein